MFPLAITITITVHSAQQLLRLHDMLAESSEAAHATSEAAAGNAHRAERTSAAPTAPSPRTAEAAPSQPDPSAAAPETKAESSGASPTATPAAAPSASAPADDKPFEYATLQKAVNERVAKFGKDALLAIAAKHGSPASFKGLPADKWQAAHADVIALGA